MTGERSLMELTDSIQEIKGIGDKTAAAYRRLKINTIEQLLEHYPRYYLSYGEPVDIDKLPIGERVAIRATVNSYVEIKKLRTLNVSTFMAKDFTGSVKMLWFNSPYIKKVFHIGQTYIFVGTVTVQNYQKVMEHPEYYTEAVSGKTKGAAAGISVDRRFDKQTDTKGHESGGRRDTESGRISAGGACRAVFPDGIPGSCPSDSFSG